MNKAKLASIIVALALPPLGFLVYAVVKKGAKDSAEVAQEINWKLLRGLDYKTGKKSEELAKLNGKQVKIPGFVVPLDDDQQQSPEFLLVPSPQACIHVPPPPPNQMVMVKMEQGQSPSRSWGPVWVHGKLYLSPVESQYGKISFQLKGMHAEPYKVQ